jgi:ABC-type antimicrobial peptide transport system permease subunit
LAQSGVVSQTRLSNLAQFPTYSFLLYGVEENFLQVIFSRYYMQTEATPQFTYPPTSYSPTVPNTVRSLFVDSGKQLLSLEQNGIFVPPPITTQVNVSLTGVVSNVFYRTLNESYFDYIDIIASEALRFGGSIDSSSPVRLQVAVQVSKFTRTNVVYLAKVRAMLKKLPGFFFSSYKQTASFTSALVSMTQYQKLFMDAFYIKRNESARRNEQNTDAAPAVPNKARLMIRLNPNANSTDKAYIIDGLRNFLPDSSTFVIDTQELIGSTAVATDLLVLFFNIVAAIAVFLCFFMLWLSFSANVNENAWEFGVLRAVGLSSAQVIRAYIYEATAIIMAAILLGSTIGIFIAVTLTLQFNLFTEMPFQFAFPWILFSTVLVMSLLVAVLGSYIPARTLKEKHIAQALKGN